MGRGYVYLEDGTIDPNPVYLTDDEYREMVEKADWDYGGSGRFGIPRD
jgi:predicted nucleotidyltransferase